MPLSFKWLSFFITWNISIFIWQEHDLFSSFWLVICTFFKILFKAVFCIFSSPFLYNKIVQSHGVVLCGSFWNEGIVSDQWDSCNREHTHTHTFHYMDHSKWCWRCLAKPADPMLLLSLGVCLRCPDVCSEQASTSLHHSSALLEEAFHWMSGVE